MRLQVVQRAREHLIYARLSSVGVTDEHQPVSHEDHLVQLEEFFHENRRRLEVSLCALLHHAGAHVIVVRLGQDHAGEEVAEDVVKQRDVRREELGQVHVLQGDEHQHRLVLVGELELYGTRRAKHGDDRAHAVVVVRLRRELLGAELVGGDELARHVAGLEVTERVEDDLADHGVVRDHHRDGSEERLEVIGELGATRVARVHGDEHVARATQRQAGALEVKDLQLRSLGASDCQNLLRDDREHLEVDAVELVEARPRAGRRQTLEKLCHREVIQPVGAVENHALHRDRLGEVLRGLRLARTRGSLGRSSHVQVNRPHQSAVAPVRQRRDDQPRRVTEVLVAVPHRRVDHAHHHGGLAGLLPLVPGVSELRRPLEIVGRSHTLLRELRHDVPGVHLDDHESGERLALEFSELPAHELHDVHELRGALLGVLWHGAGAKSLLSF